MDEINRLLTREWVSGRQLRAKLNAGKWWWQKWSGPGFYATMARLVDDGWAERQTRTEAVEGVSVTITWFRAAPWDE